MSNRDTLKIGITLQGKKPYTIKRVLGKGGFGITYEATAFFTDGNIRQTMRYTLKEFFMEDTCKREPDGRVTPIFGQEEKFKMYQEHFAMEAKRMQNVCKHKGVVSVNEVFSDNGTSYYVMAFLDGETLEDYVKANGPMTETEAVTVITKVANALQYLHQERMNHLDVKPENIMLVLDESGERQPILIDFGLSRHFKKSGSPTSTLATLGCSDGYSPIEQYAGIEKFSPEADVYSLGATLLYLLTAERPCRSIEMNAAWLEEHIPATVSDQTRHALTQALAQTASARCPDMTTLLSLLPTINIKEETAPAVEKSSASTTRVIGTGPSMDFRPSKAKPILKKALIGGGIIAGLVVLFIVGSQLLQTTDSDTIAETPKEAPKTTTTEAPATAESVQTEETTPSEPLPEDKPDNKPEDKDNKSDNKPSNDVAASSPQPQKEPKTKPIASQPTATDTRVTDNKTNTTEQETTSQDGTGTKDLGYAIYEGSMRKGLPHGRGTLKFKTRHALDSYDLENRQAEAGDVLKGAFAAGHFTQGKWIKSDGTVESVHIGN